MLETAALRCDRPVKIALKPPPSRYHAAKTQCKTKTVPIMGDGRAGGGTEVPAANGDRGPI